MTNRQEVYVDGDFSLVLQGDRYVSKARHKLRLAEQVCDTYEDGAICRMTRDNILNQLDHVVSPILGLIAVATEPQDVQLH